MSELTVFTDATGLHLGAGPFFLIYSRALSQEDEDARVFWPECFKVCPSSSRTRFQLTRHLCVLQDSVKHNNMTFASQLPEGLAARVRAHNSPPSSPFVPATPSETIASDIVEPPESRGEPMDIEQ